MKAYFISKTRRMAIIDVPDPTPRALFFPPIIQASNEYKGRFEDWSPEDFLKNEKPLIRYDLESQTDIAVYREGE